MKKVSIQSPLKKYLGALSPRNKGGNTLWNITYLMVGGDPRRIRTFDSYRRDKRLNPLDHGAINLGFF